ncbi:ribosome-inactivating family protein [Roseomonas sp. HJA6]|uniref:Ribosome-inactivating family protein n=1 Tax=Roseomonas alba TaxID=2846776 RepID=A0ABS7ABJ8_9PROT|nr:ribosome-inactivating family protein [Neoroseomonas alba]MBW6399652.1 ribosome-inactivating family protein [Neoroseomonas alba]
MSGNIALLHQPDDLRSWVQLSPYLYPFCMREMRYRIGLQRQGVEVIEVWAPINAPRVAIAIDRRSLYLFGLRALPEGPWYCFRDYARPADPPGAPVIEIDEELNYSRLLGAAPSAIAMTPVQLLTLASDFGRTRASPRQLQALAALMFLVPEALRFDSVMLAAMRFFDQGFLPVAELLDTVQNWAEATALDHENVLMPHIG